MIKAVLFDFDGVIANTLIYHVQAWQTAFNITVTLEEIAIEEGAKAIEIAKQIAKKNNLMLSPWQLKKYTDKKRKIYKRITKAKIYPEIKDFIENLKLKSLKLGLVTGSIISSMNSVVGNNFFHKFDVIVTGDDVKKSKPDPEPYFTAARQLKIPPANCLVIENASRGIKSAKNAGMVCIAVKTTIHDDNLLKEADLVVNNVSEIDINLILHADNKLAQSYFRKFDNK